jgi:small subunit ribosomal protein S13
MNKIYEFNDKKLVILHIKEFMGNNKAKLICDNLGISYKTKLGELSLDKKDILSKLSVRDLFLEQKSHINRLISIGAIRGLKLKLGLPNRGQRTRSNAKTAKKLNSKRI